MLAGAEGDVDAVGVEAWAFSAGVLSPEQATTSIKTANKTLKVLFILCTFSFNEHGICDKMSDPAKTAWSGHSSLSNLITAPAHCKPDHSLIF